MSTLAYLGLCTHDIFLGYPSEVLVLFLVVSAEFDVVSAAVVVAALVTPVEVVQV